MREHYQLNDLTAFYLIIIVIFKAAIKTKYLKCFAIINLKNSEAKICERDLNLKVIFV